MEVTKLRDVVSGERFEMSKENAEEFMESYAKPWHLVVE